jgi:5-methylcytosine-specific restriction endonuclease McrA
MSLTNDAQAAWNNSPECLGGESDCNPSNHRQCYICHKTMLKSAHKSEQPNSKYAWDIDHVEPRSKGGVNAKINLKAVHVVCNQKKADSYM